jgi:hypothetical protein
MNIEKVCLVSDYSHEARLNDFIQAIKAWHPGCVFCAEDERPTVFYVDLWQPEYSDYAVRHYGKPTYLIGYSTIKENPKVFRREVKHENQN